MTADSRGFTEIGGLVVLPAFRESREKIGKQLSYARFAYIARHPKFFCRRMIVEYLPKVNPETGNRLWELIGQKFTGLSYRAADRLSVRDKEFILSLFPKEKIYGCFLPDTVVRRLGEPGPGAAKSIQMLEKIGFKFMRQVDPFDGGPHYGIQTRKIPLIRRTVFLKFSKVAGASWPDKNVTRHLVMSEKDGQIRSLVTECRIAKGRIHLTGEPAEVLRIRNGEIVSVTPFGKTR
jgi:arginine N-succinyltransferase